MSFSCSNSLDALKPMIDQPPDLVLADSHLPSFADIRIMIDMIAQKPQLIVFSSDNAQAKEAFEIGAIDFIFKPVTDARLSLALMKSMLLFNQRSKLANNFLFVKVNSRLVKISLAEIYLIEALSDYVIINLVNKKFTVHSTMKGIESLLPGSDFVRVHNSYIVRIDKISVIEGNTLAIENRVIPISHSHRKNLLQQLKII